MSVAQQLVDGLGGIENIDDLEPCIVRIRAIVNDPVAVDIAAIRATNPLGVVSSGKFVQIIVGPKSDELVDEMQEIIRNAHVPSQ
ncbi:MAG: PTS transporter subunit EIIB [Actinomycetaceae bacterium]|nr:PTS transporter subunit EIIB [Actinomycetaceae bacterium]